MTPNKAPYVSGAISQSGTITRGGFGGGTGSTSYTYTVPADSYAVLYVQATVTASGAGAGTSDASFNIGGVNYAVVDNGSPATIVKEFSSVHVGPGDSIQVVCSASSGGFGSNSSTATLVISGALFTNNL